MARIKSRLHTEICGDCGASDPSWASINHGILLCAECCSIHRSLGRHISQVKSLRQGSWSPSLLNFVNSLNAHGANSVWEHSLIEHAATANAKGGKRKPHPKDPLHPIKTDFIRAKYVNLAFVLKPNLQLDDGSVNLETELSKQLRASVRSANLETSLRLLVQGADPNYYHEEKGSTPLHVAVKSGQTSQIELLLVYGANILTKDANGHTALEIAKINNHPIIYDRLMDAMYEVTDRLCLFLGCKKLDHPIVKPLPIPEQNKIEINEQLKIARGKLQLIPNKIFEELVQDIYDEVDRREMEAIWSTSALNPEIGAVPFLPANPHLSATRNQGRQKLARFTTTEFSNLVADVLIDAERRQHLAALCPFDQTPVPNINQLKQHMRNSNFSDDEPLYDAVASDEDYAPLNTATQKNLATNSTASSLEVENLKKILLESFSEIDDLKSMVKKLSVENSDLKLRIDPEFKSKTDLLHPNDGIDNNVGVEADGHFLTENNRNTNNINNTSSSSSSSSSNSSGSNSNNISTNNTNNNIIKRPVSMFEPREGGHHQHHNRIPQLTESRTTTSMYQMARAINTNNKQQQKELILPTNDDVKQRTDVITRCIQDLWAKMQDKNAKDGFVLCADKLRESVDELVGIFPTKIKEESTKTALKHLNDNTKFIQTECTELQHALQKDDFNFSLTCMQNLRGHAYHLAMATKVLVTLFPSK